MVDGCRQKNWGKLMPEQDPLDAMASAIGKGLAYNTRVLLWSRSGDRRLGRTRPFESFLGSVCIITIS